VKCEQGFIRITIVLIKHILNRPIGQDSFTAGEWGGSVRPLVLGQDSSREGSAVLCTKIKLKKNNKLHISGENIIIYKIV